MWQKGLISAFCVLLLVQANLCEAKGYYTVSASKVFRANSPYHISVSSHDADKAAEMEVGITGAEAGGPAYSNLKTITIEPDGTKIVEIDVGPIKEGTYNLTARGLSGFVFLNNTEITLQKKSFSIFIQTDKAIYKPGDTVNFRVVVLDNNLKPFPLKGDLTVYITDSKTNRVKRWTDGQRSMSKGVFTGLVELSPNTVLGDWTIEVQAMGTTHQKMFEVAEYVLPKFEVTIDTPKLTTFKDDNLRILVRSKYTYGKPVKGEATISVFPKFYGSYQPFVSSLITRKVVEIDGKASVEFNIRDELGFKEDYQREITIEAVVEEALTGRKQNTTTSMTLYKEKYALSFTTESSKYKPGLPVEATIKVTYHDGTPVTDANNQVEIFETYKEAYEYSLTPTTMTPSASKKVYLDKNGMARVTLSIPHNITVIDVRAQYLEVTGYLGYLQRADSDSLSYVTLAVNTENPEINQEVSITVTSTKPMQTLTYLVMGRGDLLVARTIQLDNDLTTTFKFMSSFAMVPKAKLVVYYVTSDGEIVSEKANIEFRSQFQNFVKVELSKERAKPGEDLSLTISTKPNSLVALLGVDQSVNLLKSGNDFKEQDFFTELESYEEAQNYYGGYNGRVFKRFAPWFRNSFRDFDNSGMVLLTNAKEEENGKDLIRAGYKEAVVRGSAAMYEMDAGSFNELSPVSTRSRQMDEPFSGHFKKLHIRQTFVETLLWETFDMADKSSQESKTNATRASENTTEEVIQANKEVTTIQDQDKSNEEDELTGDVCKILIDFGGEEPNLRDIDLSSGFRFYNVYGHRRVVLALNADVSFSMGSMGTMGSMAPFAAPKVRTNFPETWFWDAIEDAGVDGIKTITKKVPDTITSWIITAFAVDPFSGFGMTKTPRKLEVFQPFFVSLNLPYSVKRGEVLAIPIVVFNYMDNDVDAEVTLDNSGQEFDFVDIAEEGSDSPKVELFRRKSIGIKAGSGSSLSFMIQPKKVGPIVIKVTATSPTAGDGIEMPLLVVPEGVPQFINEAIMVDLTQANSFDQVLNLKVPKNAIPDSTKIEVAVMGDPLGSTTKNIDKLIQMPSGCGEQNMILLVPNIVVLDYLTKINALPDDLKGKALKHMESGYQRQMTYKHTDNSFSAFGESDPKGSVWLTAFVARYFRKASKYIDVDDKIINGCLDWLAENQAANGSFPEVGQVSHKDMQGGAGGGIALTAYVLLTFLENKNDAPQHSNAISKALEYVVRHLDNLDDPYALSLAAYALQLANHSTKESALARLESKATSDANHKWWNKPLTESEMKSPWYGKPNSVNVEMTAYALLALSAANQQVFPILKWLIAQRNPEGGFQSTQDTVVGLTALAEVGQKISGGGSKNLDIKAKYGEGIEKSFGVTKDNAMLYQSAELPSSVRQVNVTASGSGFAVLQVAYRYNLNVTGEWPKFVVDPQVNKNSNTDYLHLTVCTSYIPDSPAVNESNMAIMEVAFPSGFTADLDSLPSLEASDKVKRVETKNGDTVLVIYFDNLDRKERCPTMAAFRTHKVAEQKPAAVTVYDYYNNAQKSRVFYEGPHAALCDICEGSDCGDKCTIKAEQQRSGQDGYWKDHDDENTSYGPLMKSGGNVIKSSVIGVILIMVYTALCC